jgi:predicted RND superfamily exporter protein
LKNRFDEAVARGLERGVRWVHARPRAVVISLLLGIGVDSGIHLVHRADHTSVEGEDLLTTPTARAVFFSALTTTVSFGSLAPASHRGVSSLGLVLAIGMVITLFANLVVLPALLALRAARAGR